MIGRLGKAAAEIALQFMSDGMPLDDAVRAGAKLMDEELSPAAEMMLKQNFNSRRSGAPLQLRNNAADMKEVQRFINNDFSLRGVAKPQDRSWNRRLLLNWPGDYFGSATEFNRTAAADKYAIRELLMDAAEGDMDVAAMLAQRLGFGELL